MSAFAVVRYWMHMFSLTSKSTPRPAIVAWNGEKVTIREGTVVEFRYYKDFLARTLKEVEKEMESKVLMGAYTMSQVEEVFGVSRMREPRPEEEVVGKGILIDVATCASMDNEDSEQLVNRLFELKCLGLEQMQQGSETTVLAFGDQEKALEWLMAIERAMEKVMVLCHILQGPPGRMTEESLQPLTNTENVRRSVVFEAEEGTGAFLSGYHKGSAISGLHRNVYRLLPYRVFRLLFVLVRLVRPLEMLALTDHVLVGQDAKKKMYRDYENHVFVSYGKVWTSTRLSRAIRRVFEEGMDVKGMNGSTYRHFAIAVSRKYLYELTRRDLERREAEQRDARVADVMVGHTLEVSDMNYSRTNNLPISSLVREDCIRVCKLWHQVHGVKTNMEGFRR